MVNTDLDLDEMLSSGENHLLFSQKVGGSNPPSSTKADFSTPKS